MIFNENRSIYRQIVEYCFSCVASGEWLPGERVPSTKEMAMRLGVNARTVMKAYDELAEEGIIAQQRGMGYYLMGDAAAQVLAARRKQFMAEEVSAFADKMRALGLSAADILPYLK